MTLLDAAGFTSVVATNCEQHYERPLALGDEITVSSVIESISPEKTTALGVGHFVTDRQDYTDASGALVAPPGSASLKFRPRSARAGIGVGFRPRRAPRRSQIRPRRRARSRPCVPVLP